MKNAHEPIIESEIFKKVQAEMIRRSNVKIAYGIAKRKETHYSSKREKHDL